jgi:signal transduction histidine kinase
VNKLGLRTRLFAWLIAAVVAGMVASTAVWMVFRSELESGPLRTMSRVVAAQVADRWDDEAAVDASVANARTQLGVDLKVRRDLSALPSNLAGHRALYFEGDSAYVPIVRNGQVVGALQFPAEAPPGRRLRQLVFFGASLIVLAIFARSVSKLVVSPLERVAEAAHKFGDGDLGARTGNVPHASPEVREVARSFDAMAARVECMVRDQRELLAAVSHELRSPLGRARVALELARDQGADVPAFARVERAMTEVDTILGDLLSITRAGLSDLHKEPTPLVPFLRHQFSETDAPRVVVEGDEKIVATIDPALFGRAVANVVDNARHHAGPGEIRVTVEPHGDHTVVSVLDHGPGLAPDMIDKAFEPFVRGDPARSRANGHQSTGLGLAIVRRVIEAHGGSASIRNVERAGKIVGAEVSIELPAA